MADLSKIQGFAVLEAQDQRLSKINGYAVLEGNIIALAKLQGYAVLDGTQTVPTPPGGGGGGGGGGSHGGGGGSSGKGGGKNNGKQKVTSAKAWAKGYFSSTWLQVISRRRGFAVVADNTVTPTPTPEQRTTPSGAPGHRRPIKFRDRFYHPERDRYALARDFAAYLEEQKPAPEVKPVKVKIGKKTVVLPAVELTPQEIVDFESILRDLNLRQNAVQEYVANLRALAHKIEQEDEAEAIALLLVA